jgi:hypothetical protein
MIKFNLFEFQKFSNSPHTKHIETKWAEPVEACEEEGLCCWTSEFEFAGFCLLSVEVPVFEVNEI